MMRIPENARFRGHKYHYVFHALRALKSLPKPVRGEGWYVPISHVKAVLKMQM